MITNADGTRYCRASIEEIIEDRCGREDYPYFSDAFGSDWVVGYDTSTPEKYRAAAYRAAARHYKD